MKHFIFLFWGLMIAYSHDGATQTNANVRIVSAGSAITDILYALDAKSTLVGVDTTSQQPKNPLPDVGYHRMLSTEGVLSLRPTHLLGSSAMGNEDTLRQLKKVGVHVVQYPSGNSIDQLIHRIEAIAKIARKPKEAGILIQKVRAQEHRLLQQQMHQNKKLKVLFLLKHSQGKLRAAGKNTSMHRIIELAGGINVAAHLNEYKPISHEAILNMQPNVIVVTNRSYKTKQEAQSIFHKIPTLKATPAGKQKKIFVIDSHALLGGFGIASLNEAQRFYTFLLTKKEG